MEMRCGKCCTDLQLPILHLLFPTAYLDDKGLDFFNTHGLDKLVAKNQEVEFGANGMSYKISMLGLIRPDVYLDDAGREFYKEHNLDDLIKSNTLVKVMHRCQHLQPNNACAIYETRPQICRDFNCKLRDDCTDPTVHPLHFRR